ncbi:MAG: serine/threonine-protein phosphatase [Acidobacteria bacterium]|nr:serine/threonine-protein phosphatase [Acidobacteriota bacterium]
MSPSGSEITPDQFRKLTRELENFRDIAQQLVPLPGEIPTIPGFDIWGGALPLAGPVGGDHITYIDFKKRFDLPARINQAREAGRPDVVENLTRCQHTGGIALIDVSGHRMTDALLAAMLHQAFLLGALYELDRFGQITRHLFENLNTRFYQSSGTNKFVSFIYGEISEDAKFRFLSAGQPYPSVFSYRHGRFMEVSPHLCLSFPPLGMLPSFNVIDRNTTESVLGFKEGYEINEWTLMGRGDILLLHSDGLTEHSGPNGAYAPQRLEQTLRDVKDLGARHIFDAITHDLAVFATPTDDISLVVIKRT